MSGSALLGKIALVTGGSGTIGRSIAKALLSQGASVVLAGRRLEKLEQARADLLTYYPGRNVSIVSSDVSKEDSVVKLFETIDQQHGGIDLLINNAGECVVYSSH
jgi:NAD(P)-dependent dehydrogenase (short-subunit alcohol dehydrogenase family)